MAGIYERDQINYPSILAAVAQARARDAERRGDYINQQGQLWGNTAKNLVNTSGRAVVGQMENGPESWSFAAEGDRSGLDRLRAEELAAENRAKEQEWQWKKMEAEHAQAEKLAKAQREAQKGYDTDKLMKEYRDALSMRDALAASSDPNDKLAQAKIAQYESAIQYYQDKLGIRPQANAPQSETPEVAEETQKEEDFRDTQTRESREKSVDQLLKGPWTNENKKKAVELVEREDRPDVKDRMLKDIENRGLTKEQRKEKDQKIIASWKPGDPIPEGFELTYEGKKKTIKRK